MTDWTPKNVTMRGDVYQDQGPGKCNRCGKECLHTYLWYSDNKELNVGVECLKEVYA